MSSALFLDRFPHILFTTKPTPETSSIGEDYFADNEIAAVDISARMIAIPAMSNTVTDANKRIEILCGVSC